MPSPLKWRDRRQWIFAVTLRRPSLFLLRDHINMLTDLGRDWSSGPHVDYHRFIPMVYVVDLDFQNFELTTNLNDQNIIDKPLIKEENGLCFDYFIGAFSEMFSSVALIAWAISTKRCTHSLNEVPT